MINPIEIDALPLGSKPKELINPILIDPIIVEKPLDNPQQKAMTKASIVKTKPIAGNVVAKSDVKEAMVQISTTVSVAEENKVIPADVLSLVKGKKGGEDMELPRILSFSCDDSGNADRFYDKHGKTVLYNKNLGKFFVWTGKFWRADDGRIVKKMVEMVLIEYRELTKKFRRVLDENQFWHGIVSCNNSKLNAAVDILKHRLEIAHEEFDKPTHLLNCKNGIVDLRTGTLLPHDKEFLLTSYIDVDYEPSAIFSGSEFRKFVNSICCGEETLCQYLQSCFGYGITGETKEQVLFFLYGKGANGKTTLIEAINGVIGNYMKHIPIEVITGVADAKGGARPSPELVHVKDARAVVCSESNEHDILNEGKVKILTGQSAIATRQLYGETFEFMPKFKVFIDTNFLPRINGGQYSMRRRIRVIPFNATFKGVSLDRFLPEKLKRADEKKAILAWLIAGAIQYYKCGLMQDDFSALFTEQYLNECDSIGRFLSQGTEAKSGIKIQASLLYKSYVAFCEENGLTAVNDTAFGKELVNRGIYKKRSAAGNVYLGLSLKM